MALERLGQYKLLSRLGSGGTGTVYKAQQETLGRLVAVKVLHPSYSKDPELLKRFKREIEISASLSHPNLVKVYDAGAEGDFWYFSMEFVQGESLRERMRGGKTTPAKEAGKLLTPLLSALSYVHARNIVHRDLKPENVMIQTDGILKLMDFGIVKVHDQTVITQEGATLGTPRYMSPEMVMGEKIDIRSDVFQMGVILYEMVAGKVPFDGASISEIAGRICDEDYTPASTLVGGLPAGFDALIAQCMAKEPKDRFQSAQDMADAIAQLATRPSSSVPRPKAMRTPRRVTPMGGTGNSGAGMNTPVIPNSTRLTNTSAPQITNPFGRTIADLRDWISNTTSHMRAMNRKRAATVSAGALGVAIVLGAALQLLSGRSAGPLAPLRIIEGARGFQARWETRQNQATEIEVQDLNASGPPRRFANEAQVSTTAHSITVPALDVGTDYQVQAIMADGSRSEPARVTISGVARLLAFDPLVRLNGTTLEITATTTVPAKVQARIIRGGKETVRPVTEDWATSHVLRIESIEPDEVIDRIELKIEGVDLKDQVALGPFYGPRRVVADLSQTLATIRAQDIDAIGDTLRSQLDQARHLARQGKSPDHPGIVSLAHPRQTLVDWLKSKGLWESMQSLGPMAPGVFGAGRVPLDDQVKLYERLGPIEDLDSLGYCYTTSTFLDVASLTAPLVSASYPDRLGQGTIVTDLTGGGVLSLMSRRYRRMLPVSRSPDGRYLRLSMGYDMDVVRTMSAEYLPGTTSEVAVDPADLGDGSRAMLLAQVANFGLDTFMELRINGKHVLRMRNHPAHFKGFDIHALIYTNVAMIENKSNIIALEFPAQILQPGKNVVEVVVDGLPGLGAAPGAQLLRLLLRFNRPGP